MKKRSRMACILWICLIALVGCERRPAEPIYIGHTAVLSGPERERGLQEVQGIQLAVEEVNADQSQWIGGKRVAVIHADTEGDLEKYGHQAMRLALVNHVAALLGGLTRAQTDQIAPVTIEYPRDVGTVLVSASGSTGSPPSINAFALGLGLGERARVADKFLSEKLKPERVVIVANGRDAGCNYFADVLSKRLAERKAMFVVQSYTDAKSLPESMRSIALDKSAVVFAGPSADAAAGREAILERNLAPVPPFLSVGDEVEAATLSHLLAKDPQLHWLASYSPNEPTEAMKKFVEKYQARFGMAPSLEAAMAYDAARLLFTAAREAKSFAAPRLGPQLEQTKDLATLAGPITMHPDHVGHGRVYVVKLDQGQPKVVFQVEPEPLPAKK